MADIESNVKVNIDTSDALTQLKLLQQQISAFQQAMKNAGAANAQAAAQMQSNLVNSINATGKFRANIQTIKTTAESFTESLEKNKMSIGEYFRYAGGASKTFGKLFKSEFETINQVARERVKELQTQYIKLGRDANGAMKAISVRPLSLDMESLAVKTQLAAQRQQLFNQLMKQGSTQLLNFGKNTQWAGRQLMVGFTIPLTLMGSAAAKAYMEIEKASISFKRVYGDINTTAGETEKMVKQVQALASEFTKYGLAVADTMDMAAKAAAMGKTGVDLLAQIDQAAKLSVLGNVDQAQALETTISLTNAFRVSTDELASSVDFLNAVENQTVVSIEDLTIAIPKAAPVVQQLGGDVKDLTFFLTAMKEGGINASEGANALKSGLASMINPTKKASDFLATFGVNIQAIVEGNKGDIKQTVIDFARALDTLDPLNRARAIEQMFGKFQFSRLSTLFQNVIAEGSQATKVAGLANQTAEELAVLSERELKKVSDSPMFKFQKSIEQMQAKLAPVGEAFLKAVTPIIEFVTKILDGFNNLSSGTKSFITILVTAVAGIGPILLMTFGLIANGVANVMKLFTNMKSFINKTTKPSDMLGEQTEYMNTEQLKAAAVAASLDQAHAKLKQTFDAERGAIEQLTQAYRNAVNAQQAFTGVPGVPVGDANAMTPKKYAKGVSMVPGPKGAGDIVPALLSPGEAVIPAKHAQKYAPVIAGMVAGNLPGFENGTTGVGMRQSVYGPMTLKQTEGLARTGVQLKDISDEVMAGPYANVPPTDFGTQISPTSGHSFPAFEVGGIYQKPDGTKVFVKPQIDLTGAMAEVRGTEIARSAHGLVAPKQEIRVMMDPTDPERKRRFLVLESALDERIANVPNKFSNNEYFTQLVASLLRGDKDLGIGNLGGNILADVGPAGVFGRASGKRALGSAINSMEEQAIINLLGVKGGAKRFFAEATAEQISKMAPGEYNAAMQAEMQRVAPKLQATIAGFGNMSPEEQAAYQAMQQRLQTGMTVDWSKYQIMHSAVKPKEYKKGVVSAGFASPKNPMAFAQSLQAMSNEEIKKQLRVQDTHLVTALDIKDPKFLAQVQRVYPGATKEELELFEPVSNLTAQLPGNANQVMKGKSGYPGSFFRTVWDGLENKLSKTAQIAGVSLNESQTIENEIGSVIGSYPELINDTTMGDIIGQVLGSTAKITDDAMMKRRMWELSERVAGLRSKPKKANSKSGDGMGIFAEEESSAQTTDIIRKMLQDDALYWDKTTLRRKLASGAEGPRFGGVNIDQFGHSSGSIEDIAARRLAQETLQELIANPNMPMPRLPRAFSLPDNWDKTSAGMSDEQQIAQLVSMAKQGAVKVLNNNDNNLAKRKPGKPAPLSFTKRDADDKTFNIGKEASGQAYNSSRLKGSPLNWAANQTNVLEAYNAMSQPFESFQPIIPPTASGLKFFNDLALKMEEGGIVPGAKAKPKASVFDIDDTLLDLSSFMETHKAENEKLPEGQKKKWYKEVAKDPKGIPAGLAALKAAQARGNKILLMTARPDFYEPYTIETLQKLGIDMNGIKLIARRDKDYRKPEQMKYDKTSAYMKYYDIEEFYDDMPATRGAISLLGINTINPLKLAKGGIIPGIAGGLGVGPLSANITTKDGNFDMLKGNFKDKQEMLDILSQRIAEDFWIDSLGEGDKVSDYLVNGIPAEQYFKGLMFNNEIVKGYNKGGMVAGYANGVFSVPGPKGAGDVVPAMLSPGEAVIPARQAAKHRPMIQQMIAGNVPGYEIGKNDPAPGESLPKIPGVSGPIPGVTAPLPIVQQDAGKTEKFLDGIKNAVKEGAKKAVSVIGEKAKEATETALIPFVRYLTNDEVTFTDEKGNTRFNADTKETLDKDGNVVAKQVDLEKQKADLLEEQRVRVEEELEATDQEYVTERRKVEQLEIRLAKNEVLNAEELAQLENSKKILEEKRNLVRKEMGFENEKAVKEKSGFFTRTKGTGNIQSAAYGLTTAITMLSTIPGQIGESAQKALLPIGSFTTAMSIIPGKAGILVGVLAAMVTAGIQVNEHLAKTSQESARLANAMGAGAVAIGKFAEFAKTVSGTEAMNKQRQASAGQFFNVVEGKTTFGESYMKSDAGKQLVKDVNDSIKQGGTGGLDDAKTLITNQLTTAIAAGVMTPGQARSIAANLGAEMKDMQFGLEVSGRITDLVGPKGEDLKNDPLLVRMRLVEEAGAQFEKQAGVANSKINAGTTTGNIVGAGVVGGVGGIAAGVGAGIAGGAIASGLTSAGIGAGASAILGAQAFGPVVGIIAGIGIATAMIVNYQTEVAKNAGILQANLGNVLSVQQQMIDSLEIDYQKRIASAKAAGDIAEATRLQNQYLEDQAKLLEVNAKQTADMYDVLDKQGIGFAGIGDMQTALGNTANDAIKKAFEGTGQEVGAQLATDTINAMSASTNQKTMLKTAVAQKLIGFDQIGTASEVFGKDQAGADQLQKLIEQSPTEAGRALGLATNLKGDQKKQFLVDMSLKDPIATKQMNDALEMAQKTTGVFFGQKQVAEAVMKFAVENPEQMLQFKANIDALKDQKTITLAVVQKIMGPSISNLLGDKGVAKFFTKYNKENKIVFLTELQQVMAMKGDPEMIASWNLWNKENGQTKSFAEYAAYQADRTVTTQGVDNTFGAGEKKDSGAGSGPQASILDQFVQMAREGSNFQQKLTVGWDASYKALKNYTTKSISLMAGWAVRLKQQGVDANIIDIFMGATEEEQNKILDKRTGKLKAGAFKLLSDIKKIKDMREFGLTYVLARDTERMAKDNELFQAGLDVIAGKEKKINDRYDKRIKALDEIGKLQERNNQQQQDTLTIADALSKGDIAGAARAAQKARENMQRQALENAKASVEKARQDELAAITVKILDESKTRAQIEADMVVNTEKIAAAKLLEMNRQITIGKNAVIAADAAARQLKNNKLINQLPGFNSTSSTSSKTKTTTDDEEEDKDPGKTTTKGAGLKGAVLTSATSAAGQKAQMAKVDAVIAQKNDGTGAAKEASQAYFTAKAKAGPEMSNAEAEKKFGKGTQKFKDWQANQTALAAALTKAESFGIVSGGKVKTSADIDALTAKQKRSITNSAGNQAVVTELMKQIPAEIADRAAVIKNAANKFTKDQTELDGLKQSLLTAMGKVSGASMSTLAKDYQKWLGTADAARPSTVFGKIIAAGGDPEAYMKKASGIAKYFVTVDKYRSELRAGGYSDQKLYQAGLFDYNFGDYGQTTKQTSDFTTGQMFAPKAAFKGGTIGFAKGNIIPDGENITRFSNKYYAMGGMVYANKGLEIAASKYALGTDTIPAMLTPGEFVMQKSAVDSIGADRLTAMNNGTSVGESVYNYSITVNATGNGLDANDLARQVMEQIKRVDSQRIRSNNY